MMPRIEIGVIVDLLDYVISFHKKEQEQDKNIKLRNWHIFYLGLLGVSFFEGFDMFAFIISIGFVIENYFDNKRVFKEKLEVRNSVKEKWNIDLFGRLEVVNKYYYDTKPINDLDK